MTESIDERLKNAELERAQAETEKVRAECREIGKSASRTKIIEVISVFSGLIVGMGGILAAHTQYENAEIRAAHAKEVMEFSERLAVKANAERDMAESARDKATRERIEVEAAKARYKDALSVSAAELASIAPRTERHKLVYIQFQGAISRRIIDQLRSALESKGYSAPEAERLEENYRPMVKYFSRSDEKDARKLAEETQVFFSKKGCSITFSVVEATASKPTSPPEIWIPHNCKDGAQ